MSSWLCYAIGVAYAWASVAKYFEAKTEHDYWLAVMLLCYAIASAALGKVT